MPSQTQLNRQMGPGKSDPLGTLGQAESTGVSESLPGQKYLPVPVPKPAACHSALTKGGSSIAEEGKGVDVHVGVIEQGLGLQEGKRHQQEAG